MTFLVYTKYSVQGNSTVMFKELLNIRKHFAVPTSQIEVMVTNVRYGSKAVMTARLWKCPLSANSGHCDMVDFSLMQDKPLSVCEWVKQLAIYALRQAFERIQQVLR